MPHQRGHRQKTFTLPDGRTIKLPSFETPTPQDSQLEKQKLIEEIKRKQAGLEPEVEITSQLFSEDSFSKYRWVGLNDTDYITNQNNSNQYCFCASSWIQPELFEQYCIPLWPGLEGNAYPQCTICYFAPSEAADFDHWPAMQYELMRGKRTFYTNRIFGCAPDCRWDQTGLSITIGHQCHESSGFIQEWDGSGNPDSVDYDKDIRYLDPEDGNTHPILNCSNYCRAAFGISSDCSDTACNEYYEEGGNGPYHGGRRLWGQGALHYPDPTFQFVSSGGKYFRHNSHLLCDDDWTSSGAPEVGLDELYTAGSQGADDYHGDPSADADAGIDDTDWVYNPNYLFQNQCCCRTPGDQGKYFLLEPLGRSDEDDEDYIWQVDNSDWVYWWTTEEGRYRSSKEYFSTDECITNCPGVCKFEINPYQKFCKTNASPNNNGPGWITSDGSEIYNYLGDPVKCNTVDNCALIFGGPDNGTCEDTECTTYDSCVDDFSFSPASGIISCGSTWTWNTSTPDGESLYCVQPSTFIDPFGGFGSPEAIFNALGSYYCAETTNEGYDVSYATIGCQIHSLNLYDACCEDQFASNWNPNATLEASGAPTDWINAHLNQCTYQLPGVCCNCGALVSNEGNVCTQDVANSYDCYNSIEFTMPQFSAQDNYWNINWGIHAGFYMNETSCEICSEQCASVILSPFAPPQACNRNNCPEGFTPYDLCMNIKNPLKWSDNCNASAMNDPGNTPAGGNIGPGCVPIGKDANWPFVINQNWFIADLAQLYSGALGLNCGLSQLECAFLHGLDNSNIHPSIVESITEALYYLDIGADGVVNALNWLQEIQEGMINFLIGIVEMFSGMDFPTYDIPDWTNPLDPYSEILGYDYETLLLKPFINAVYGNGYDDQTTVQANWLLAEFQGGRVNDTDPFGYGNVQSYPFAMKNSSGNWDDHWTYSYGLQNQNWDPIGSGFECDRILDLSDADYICHHDNEIILSNTIYAHPRKIYDVFDGSSSLIEGTSIPFYSNYPVGIFPSEISWAGDTGWYDPTTPNSIDLWGGDNYWGTYFRMEQPIKNIGLTCEAFFDNSADLDRCNGVIDVVNTQLARDNPNVIPFESYVCSTNIASEITSDVSYSYHCAWIDWYTTYALGYEVAGMYEDSNVGDWNQTGVYDITPNPSWRNKKQGCTNVTARNYDSLANYDDGSCESDYLKIEDGEVVLDFFDSNIFANRTRFVKVNTSLSDYDNKYVKLKQTDIDFGYGTYGSNNLGDHYLLGESGSETENEIKRDFLKRHFNYFSTGQSIKLKELINTEVGCRRLVNGEWDEGPKIKKSEIYSNTPPTEFTCWDYDEGSHQGVLSRVKEYGGAPPADEAPPITALQQAEENIKIHQWLRDNGIKGTSEALLWDRKESAFGAHSTLISIPETGGQLPHTVKTYLDDYVSSLVNWNIHNNFTTWNPINELNGPPFGGTFHYYRDVRSDFLKQVFTYLDYLITDVYNIDESNIQFLFNEFTILNKLGLDAPSDKYPADDNNPDGRWNNYISLLRKTKPESGFSDYELSEEIWNRIVIGIQGHVFTQGLFDPTQLELHQPHPWIELRDSTIFDSSGEYLWRVLETLANASSYDGVRRPIQLTELDFSVGPWTYGMEDLSIDDRRQIHAQWLNLLLHVFYAHPQVERFSMWGVEGQQIGNPISFEMYHSGIMTDMPCNFLCYILGEEDWGAWTEWGHYAHPENWASCPDQGGTAEWTPNNPNPNVLGPTHCGENDVRTCSPGENYECNLPGIMKPKFQVYGTGYDYNSDADKQRCRDDSGDPQAKVRGDRCFGKSDNYDADKLFQWNGTDFDVMPSGKVYKDFFFGKLWLGDCYDYNGTHQEIYSNKIDCEDAGHEWYRKCKWMDSGDSRLYCIGQQLFNSDITINSDYSVDFPTSTSGFHQVGTEIYTNGNEDIHLHYGNYKLEFLTGDFSSEVDDETTINNNRSKDPADWYQYDCSYDRSLSCEGGWQESPSIECFSEAWEENSSSLDYMTPNGYHSLFTTLSISGITECVDFAPFQGNTTGTCTRTSDDDMTMMWLDESYLPQVADIGYVWWNATHDCDDLPDGESWETSELECVCGEFVNYHDCNTGDGWAFYCWEGESEIGDCNWSAGAWPSREACAQECENQQGSCVQWKEDGSCGCSYSPGLHSLSPAFADHWATECDCSSIIEDSTVFTSSVTLRVRCDDGTLIVYRNPNNYDVSIYGYDCSELSWSNIACYQAFPDHGCSWNDETSQCYCNLDYLYNNDGIYRFRDCDDFTNYSVDSNNQYATAQEACADKAAPTPGLISPSTGQPCDCEGINQYNCVGECVDPNEHCGGDCTEWGNTSAGVDTCGYCWNEGIHGQFAGRMENWNIFCPPEPLICDNHDGYDVDTALEWLQEYYMNYFDQQLSWRDAVENPLYGEIVPYNAIARECGPLIITVPAQSFPSVCYEASIGGEYPACIQTSTCSLCEESYDVLLSGDYTTMTGPVGPDNTCGQCPTGEICVVNQYESVCQSDGRVGGDTPTDDYTRVGGNMISNDLLEETRKGEGWVDWLRTIGRHEDEVN